MKRRIAPHCAAHDATGGSAKPRNGANPSSSSVQVAWVQKYGDVIDVFGDADLGACKMTYVVDLFKESAGMAPFHQWKLSTQLWYAKQFALGQVECSSRYLDQEKSNKIYQCGMTFAHTYNVWGSFCLPRISALEVPTKFHIFIEDMMYDLQITNIIIVFWDEDQVGIPKRLAMRPSIWI